MRIFLESLGCRLNQGEIEKIGSQFRAAGHILVSDASEADLVVINTCSVTAKAASESRGKIRQISRAGKAEIIVTGCWATLEPEMAASLPGVHHVVPNAKKDSLAADILELPPAFFDRETPRQRMPGVHARTRAFIKVQDGCDNHCTYCVTRLARGKGRSTPIQQVLADVHAAEAGGIQEIILTGVHLASWGQDLTPVMNLRHLTEMVLSETSIPRLRLSSLEPWDLDDSFLNLWQEPRLCRQLHMPLQSGCASTLRRMARRTTPLEYKQLVNAVRSAYPDMAVTTDLIVGFPGETAVEFAESLAFVEEIDFSAGHVFAYSPRSGTPAAAYPDQISPQVKKQRSTALRTVLAAASLRFRQKFIGAILPVLWISTQKLGVDRWKMEGLTDTYLHVATTNGEPLHNQISQVKLEQISETGLVGTITKSP